MTITVDDRGDERAAFSPSQRQAPPNEALWYQARRLSAKGWSSKKAKGFHNKAVGGGSVSAAHCFFMGSLAFVVDRPFADNRQA